MDAAARVAWISYLPVPGLQLIPVWMHPHSRLARYHAWQGGTVLALTLAALFVFGLLGGISDAAGFQATIGLFSGAVLLAWLFATGQGLAGALRGRFPRVFPAAHLLAAIGR